LFRRAGFVTTPHAAKEEGVVPGSSERWQSG
jgi:hypothetical protein